MRKVLKSGSQQLVVLDEVEFTVSSGEFVAICGPSGSGKSTLLAVLAGLDPVSAGEIFIDETPIHNLSEDELAAFRRDRVGFVFQSFQLFENFTAEENIRIPLELIGRPQAKERALELLERVGLKDRTHHYPRQLSGGEQQRVAIARAFSTEPKILFADEPTGSLDQQTGEEVLDFLEELRERIGTTLILVTHDPDVAARADRRFDFVDGRLEVGVA